MVYVGSYALIYLHSILAEGIVSRDGLPRGVLPSGILKIEKYCPGLKVRFPTFRIVLFERILIFHFQCELSNKTYLQNSHS